MAFAEGLELANSKPGFHQHPPPFIHSMRANMRRVANRFYAVEKASSSTAGHYAIFQQELPTGAQNATNLADKCRRVGKVMRCGAAGDDIERGVIEGQRVGVR